MEIYIVGIMKIGVTCEYILISSSTYNSAKFNFQTPKINKYYFLTWWGGMSKLLYMVEYRAHWVHPNSMLIDIQKVFPGSLNDTMILIHDLESILTIQRHVNNILNKIPTQIPCGNYSSASKIYDPWRTLEEIIVDKERMSGVKKVGPKEETWVQ